MADACCGPAESSHASDDHETDGTERLRDVPELRAAALAALLFVGGWLSGRLGLDVLGTVLAVAALLVGGATFVPESVRGLLRGRLGVGTLMTIAAAGAVALGEIGEAAALAVLFSIAEGLESYSLARTRHSLRALLDLTPARVSLLRDGVEVSVDPDEVAVGDRVLLRPGERAATDGTVGAGRSAVDTAAITGESMPV
ncbi:MAG: cadmium-transporting ATPase, partial [Nitriliruptor sp.]